jgi:alkanesulfonate monooxygenase SsuD/methylene tetrahydromethanopterin reductase-like flavin-dependent oxidoreductase (luciferase family)
VKLCLSIEIQEGLSYEQTLALARAAEQAGFDAALLAEHYASSAGAGDRSAADAWIYLAGLARETERIRLGTLVSPVTFRHPAVLAKLAATLDHVSGGRAELGVGAGWLEAEHSAYGFPFPSPGRRVDLLEEQLQVISGLWTQDPFSHDGSAYRLRECRFTPKPLQQPHPPLIVGGRPSSKRLPRLAARYADEYVITLPAADECEQVKQLVAGACPLSVFTYACVADEDHEVERQVAALAQELRPGMCDRDRWVTGTPAEAAEQLNRLAAVGVQRVFLAAWSESHLKMLPLLSRYLTGQVAEEDCKLGRSGESSKPSTSRR